MKKMVYEAPGISTIDLEDDDVVTTSGYLDWEEEGEGGSSELPGDDWWD